MNMPGREYVVADEYRYGFNGKENDKDAGKGIQDYGMRIYDSRLGKFLSVDPLANDYPWNSVYAFAENSVIANIDLDGAERFHFFRFKNDQGKTVLALSSVEDIIEYKWRFVYIGFFPKLFRIKQVNQRKEYFVWQEDEIEVYPAGTTTATWQYDEHVKYPSYEKAKNATDKDFNSTEEDHDNSFSGALIEVGPIVLQKGFKGRMSRAVAKTIMEWHHIIPKSLQKASAFVRLAQRGGFSINSLKNLTPLQKYFTAWGIGRHAKHPKYTEQINKFLNKQDLSLFTPESAKNFLMEVNQYILKKIESSTKKLNDLDLQLDKFEYKGK